MVLVPEIVLTPQMMRKFSSYFGDQVAMLHSSLKMTERYDQWKRIRRGEVDVVLGTRSAHVRAPEKSGPHHHGRGAGGKLSVGKRAPVRCPGGCQIPLRPGEGGAGVRFRYASRWRPLGRRNRGAIKGAAAAALQRKRLAGGPHCGSASGDLERQPGPDQHPAAAGAGKNLAAGSRVSCF